MPRSSTAKQAQAELLKFALGYPEAREDRPWGETVAKVKKKVFVFLGKPGDALSISVKLPRSATVALSLPFVAPTGYGLGKAGWVTASFEPRSKLPMPMLKQWIDESYRSVAPATLVKKLAGPEATKPSRAKAVARR